MYFPFLKSIITDQQYRKKREMMERVVNKVTCSAARPPSVMQVISNSCSLVIRRFSLGTYWANPRAAVPRGTIVTLSKGSACSKNQPATA